MIESRNQTSHTYNKEVAKEIVKNIREGLAPAIENNILGNNQTIKLITTIRVNLYDLISISTFSMNFTLVSIY